MSRSLSLAAYLALHRGVERKNFAAHLPMRPDGSVVWVRGQSDRHVRIAAAIAQALGRDGDKVTLLATGPSEGTAELPTNVLCLRNPEETVADTRAFLRHFRPDALVWMGGHLDPITLVETDKAGIRRILADSSGEGLASTVNTWVPGMTARLLERFDFVLAISARAKGRLLKHGVAADKVDMLGPLDEAMPILSHSEHERQILARTLGPRPIWLAASVEQDELMALVAAQKLASRRTHRLLMILVPTSPECGPDFCKQLRELGFTVALRSAGEEPEEETQIYIADTADELGLWYRIAPISYIGGSLTTGLRRHPYEAAALGSAIVHGPMLGPYSEAMARLDANQAARQVDEASDLGIAIESLLSPDKAAQLANAAWGVTSEGAEAANRLVGLIQSALDQRGA